MLWLGSMGFVHPRWQMALLASPPVPFCPLGVQNAMDPVTACNNCILYHGCTAPAGNMSFVNRCTLTWSFPALVDFQRLWPQTRWNIEELFRILTTVCLLIKLCIHVLVVNSVWWWQKNFDKRNNHVTKVQCKTKNCCTMWRVHGFCHPCGQWNPRLHLPPRVYKTPWDTVTTFNTCTLQ